MFWIFAVDVAAVRARLLRKNPFASPELISALVSSARPKRLVEFAMPDTARAYADVLRATGNFEKVAVMAMVLVPPRSDYANPRRRFVDLSAFSEIDGTQQGHLHALLNGGRFAPRSLPQPRRSIVAREGN